MNIKLFECVEAKIDHVIEDGNKVVVATVIPKGKEQFELKYPLGVATASMLRKDVKSKLGI
ncbi:hypothetical protein [Niameybacter massiliensis]|uniref:hypothetical protein n=1 Tax=Niameybacter massiliensis TaxID=1658108 RepID=UPI0006B40BB9|nr:hypothetical protein [Niameybacter massiliensis]